MGEDLKQITDTKEISKLQKQDYLIAATCGAIAGLVDILFVGSPESSIIGDKVDKKTDELVMKAAQWFWKNDKRTQGKNKNKPDTLEKCISYLEQAFPVNYDARYAKDLVASEGVLSDMTPKNHHIKALGHSTDIIGLIFSIIDQFNSEGTASFIDKGKIIHVAPAKSSGAIPWLQGSDIESKLFCGFINWIGHLLSDISGSSSTRKEGKNGRGMGVPMPFYELFLMYDNLKLEGFAETMISVYERGYDLRHGITTTIPVILDELMLSSIWVIRNRFEEGKSWKDSLLSLKEEKYRLMKLISNGTLCIFDLGEAAVYGIKDRSWVSFICHLNMAGWTRLTILGVKEAAIRLGILVNESEDAFLERIFGKLSEEDKARILAFEQMIKNFKESLNVINVLKKSLDEYAVSHERRIQIERECNERIAQLQTNRNEMLDLVENYLSGFLVAFGEGIEEMEYAVKTNNVNSYIKGNTVIQAQLGHSQQFSDMAEFDDLMGSDDAFKL